MRTITLQFWKFTRNFYHSVTFDHKKYIQIFKSHACVQLRSSTNLQSSVTVKCDRIWENPACCDACAIILLVAVVITLRNSYLLSYGEINLSSILYYVYRRRYRVTSPQKADLFECSWRPERAAVSSRSPLLEGTN